jgi:hypothetical protein
LAIEKGHIEVVNVLLYDLNWRKLIKTSTTKNKNILRLDQPYLLQLEVHNPQSSISNKKNDLDEENSQLNSMYDQKMWDSFKIILDKCYFEEEYDFSLIDTDLKPKETHPLMLIAKSRQESLIKHDVVHLLLNLKWKLIPRLVFLLNILLYLAFLILITLYSIDLADFGQIGCNINNGSIITTVFTSTFTTSIIENLTTFPPYRPIYNQTTTRVGESFDQCIDGLDYISSYSMINILLFVIISLNLFKELIKFFILDGLTYFSKLKNWIVNFSYALAIFSIFLSHFKHKAALGSFAVLFAFLIFPIYLQKFKLFGIFIVAFYRTVKNSAKFLPIFFFIFVGFYLSFKIRSNFGIDFFSSVPFSLIRVFSMITGELETDKMGIKDDIDGLPNFIVYFLFIMFMSVILINLLIGKFLIFEFFEQLIIYLHFSKIK